MTAGGLARAKVFKHGHEEATGRTSSIGQHNLCVSCVLPCSRASIAAKESGLSADLGA